MQVSAIPPRQFPEQLEEQLDKTIIVRKTYQPMEDEHKVGRMTRVTVEVILPEDAPDGIYQIVDSIPCRYAAYKQPQYAVSSELLVAGGRAAAARWITTAIRRMERFETRKRRRTQTALKRSTTSTA